MKKNIIPLCYMVESSGETNSSPGVRFVRGWPNFKEVVALTFTNKKVSKLPANEFDSCHC